MKMGLLLRSVPDKHVFLYLKNNICRPDHLCNSTGLHYNAIHDLDLHKSKALEYF